MSGFSLLVGTSSGLDSDLLYPGRIKLRVFDGRRVRFPCFFSLQVGSQLKGLPQMPFFRFGLFPRFIRSLEVAPPSHDQDRVFFRLILDNSFFPFFVFFPFYPEKRFFSSLYWCSMMFLHETHQP